MQTDSSPYQTSIGHETSQEGVAISQDLLVSQRVCYGDMVYIPGYGSRIVNDVMNVRHKNAVDIWVPDKDSEKKIGRIKVHVYIMKTPERDCTRGDAMAMVNAKKVKRLIEAFVKENGRQPTVDELKRLMRGGV